MSAFSWWTFSVGGVDDQVGLGLDRLEQRALALDRVGHAAAAVVQRVLAPAAAVALDQLGRRCVEEQHAHPVLLAQPADRVAAPPRGAPWARRPATASMYEPGPLLELDDLVEQLDRQVVDDEPAEVLEVVRGLRTPCARQPGDHEDLGHTDDRTWSSFVVRRYSSRGMVAAASYSSALARKPAGGAGSSIRCSSRPLPARALT